MTHDTDHLTRLLHEIAADAVPNDLRPDPPLTARRTPRRAPRRGGLTLAAALLVTVLAGIVLATAGQPAAEPYATALQITATPSPLPPPDAAPVSRIVSDAPLPVTLQAGEAFTFNLPAQPEGQPPRLAITVAAAPDSSALVDVLHQETHVFSFDAAALSAITVDLGATASAEGDTLTLRAGEGFPAEGTVTLHMGLAQPGVTVEGPAVIVAADAAPDATPLATVEIPPNTVAVSLPDSLVTALGGSLADGATVDVYATLLLVEIDAEFQAPVPALPSNAALPDGATQSREDTNAAALDPQVTLQRIIQGAQVVRASGQAGVVTLAVDPQAAATLTWVIDAGQPLTLVVREPAAVAEVVTTPLDGAQAPVEPLADGPVQVGAATLYGHTILAGRDELHITLVWEAGSNLDGQTISLHLVDADGNLVDQIDRPALPDDTAADVQDGYLRHNFVFEGLSAGDYFPEVSLYDAATGAQQTLTLLDGSTTLAYVLGRVPLDGD